MIEYEAIQYDEELLMKCVDILDYYEPFEKEKYENKDKWEIIERNGPIHDRKRQITAYKIKKCDIVCTEEIDFRRVEVMFQSENSKLNEINGINLNDSKSTSDKNKTKYTNDLIADNPETLICNFFMNLEYILHKKVKGKILKLTDKELTLSIIKVKDETPIMIGRTTSSLSGTSSISSDVDLKKSEESNTDTSNKSSSTPISENSIKIARPFLLKINILTDDLVRAEKILIEFKEQVENMAFFMRI